MKWTESFEVRSHDTDLSGRVTSSALLRMMQQTANCQCRAIGPSNEELRGRGLAFVVSRMALEVYQPLSEYDRIEVTTATCDSRGAQFNRSFEVARGGERAAAAYSVWALIDTETHRIRRVSDLCEGYLAEPTDAPPALSVPARIRIPEGTEFADAGEYRVAYRDTDINGHMNNTVYADLLLGYLPIEKREVSSFSICYSAEAPMGEKLRIFTADSGNGVYFVRTLREDGRINTEAEFIFR